MYWVTLTHVQLFLVVLENGFEKIMDDFLGVEMKNVYNENRYALLLLAFQPKRVPNLKVKLNTFLQ